VLNRQSPDFGRRSVCRSRRCQLQAAIGVPEPRPAFSHGKSTVRQGAGPGPAIAPSRWLVRHAITTPPPPCAGRVGPTS